MNIEFLKKVILSNVDLETRKEALNLLVEKAYNHNVIGGIKVSSNDYEEIVGFIKSYEKIKAIKKFKDISFGLGLKECKDAIDSLTEHLMYVKKNS